MFWSKIQSPLYSETDLFWHISNPSLAGGPYFGSSCRYGLIYHASLVGQSAPALKARTGDGISVRSLCWASHVLLYPGPFPTYAEWNISIMFRVFFHECRAHLFFFGGGFRGFPKKVRLFLGQTNNNNNMAYIFLSFLFWWVTQGKISRVLAAKLSLCCRVDALGDQALLPRMEMGWWGWWRVGDKVGERLSWWQICKHMYIYIDTPMEMEKNHVKKTMGAFPFGWW